jgi:phosphoribosylformylglycinamidine synthase
VGATITLENPGVELLSETPGRVVVAIRESHKEDLVVLAEKYSIPLAALGTTGGDALVINEATIALDELRIAHTETFKKLFG